MKYDFDTYEMYKSEVLSPFSIRVRVTMKEDVDIDVLKKSVNKALERYPYLAVKVIVNEEGAYELRPNDKEVVVIRTPKKPLGLGSSDTNDYLLYVDCEGRDIYFNISHALCGGGGAFPWLMTNVWQYVKDRHGIEPVAPGIRKPGEPLLEYECAVPDMSMLSDEEPIVTYKTKNPAMLLKDYMNGLFNPFVRNENYYYFTFNQKDIMNFARDNDASVISFFMVAVAKALDKVLPSKVKVIGIETAHNTVANLGIPGCHSDFLSHIIVDYEREQLKWDIEKLHTMTRGQIILRSDLSVDSIELRKKLELYEKLDTVKGLKNKKAFMKKNDVSTGDDAVHGTSMVNYTGRMDWGEVADYVESYVAIVGGHTLCEISSMADKIFMSMMLLLDTRKYVDALKAVMDELGIECTISGPYPKQLAKHALPK